MEGQEQGAVQLREPVPPENWYSNVSLQEAKSFIRSNLVGAARSFIAVGYYLKQIRDRELFREEGFETIWDFAMEEYGISKSTASRYMKMNDRFSKDGNSPVLHEKYKEFGKSQLQEMLSLDEEQLEQVTPADRVEDIRDMRRKKEIPYIEIPGQVSLSDFPGIEPEERMAQEVQQLYAGPPAEDLRGRCTVTIGELAGAGEEPGEAVAISQQEKQGEAESLSAYGTPKRVYPPESLIVTEGCEGGHDCFSCAMECEIRGKERYCREAPMGNPFPCEVVRCGFEELGDRCQFVSHDLAEHTAGSYEANPCCKNCKEPCEYICSRAMRALEQAEAGTETAEDPEETDEAEAWEEAEPQEERKPERSDLELLREMLEKEKKKLADAIKVNAEEPDLWLEQMIRKSELMAGALAGMIGRLGGAEDNSGIGGVQPELPVMKNNEQRKEWLRDYQAWGLWYEDFHIGARYYKYDFDNGARLIAEEYTQKGYKGCFTSSYFHLVGGPEPPRHPTYGYGRWGYHEEYTRSPDSETELVEFLKYVQRGRKDHAHKAG